MASKLWILLSIGIAALVAVFLFSIRWSIAWLTPLGRKYAPIRKLIVAQARHETGRFKSDLFWRSWNAFGMGIAVIRKQSKKGDAGNNYASYWCPAQSLYDLFLWLDYNGYEPDANTTALEYATFLRSRGYYTDTLANYAGGIQSHLS